MTALATCLSVGVVSLGFAPTPEAMATGSGDYCGPGHYLTGEQECVHQYATYKETEGWNTYGEGLYNCSGVTKEALGLVWEGWACSSGPAPYHESWCTEFCNGDTGYGMVEDDQKSTAGYFTGWGYWN